MEAGRFHVLFPGYSDTALQFLNRTSGMTRARANIEAQYIDGLVSDGIWSIADCLYLLAQDTNNKLLNLKSASFPLTVNGSPTFTVDSGYAGSGTTNLQSYNASTAGGQYSQDGASVFTWTPTTFGSGADSGATAGYLGASSNVYLYPHFSDNKFYWQANSAGGENTTYVSANFYGSSRTGSQGTDNILYQDLAASSGASGTSAALVNDNFVLLNRISNGSPFAGTVSMGWFGGGMTAANVASLYRRTKIRMQLVSGALSLTA